MAVSLADLIAEVEDFLSAHGADREQATTLTTASGIDASATTFAVSDGSKVSTGLVEIDYELIAVESKSGNTITVPAWGRGQRGTTAATHAQNAKVSVNPRFPRSRIKAEINQAIANLYPSLFGVGTTTVTSVAGTVSYELPAAAEGVLKVAFQGIGTADTWHPLRRYRFDRSADTTAFTTGRSLDILEGVPAGVDVQVVYRKKFSELAADADTLTVAGLEDSWRDLVTLQVCSKMVLALDTARLQTWSVEQQNRAGIVPVGSAVSVARRLQDTYKERLEQERMALLAEYPARSVYVG